MRKATFILSLVLAAGMLFSCSKQNPNFKDIVLDGTAESGELQGLTRSTNPETRRVLIMYSAGFNSLSGYLKSDLEDIKQGYVPTPHRTSDVLLIISRQTVSGTDTRKPSEPVLVRLTREEGKELVCDTLKRWSGDTPIASASFMREALDYIKMRFPAAGYGMIFSSHGTGWLPSEYYAHPEKYEGGDSFWAPVKRTLGQDEGYESSDDAEGGKVVLPYSEIELKDLPGAIPFHLDYMLVDACLMGGIEFAYQMKDVCDKIAFSQTEILAEGLDYNTVVSRLLEGKTPDVLQVCKDYFNMYDQQEGSQQSATISLVDCTSLEPLASVCEDLFNRYNYQIRHLNAYAVQRYYRQDHHYFYDLEDILIHAGITAEEKAALEQALDQAIIYKAATPSFLGVEIKIHSGFSMYLPSKGTAFLDSFYKENIAWNARTGLVQ